MERSAYCCNKDSQISPHLIHHTRYLLVFTENNYIHLSDKKISCHECKKNILPAKFHHEVNALLESKGELKWIGSDLPGMMVALRTKLSLKQYASLCPATYCFY